MRRPATRSAAAAAPVIVAKKKRNRKTLPSTLNQLIKHVPGNNEPVVVFPNVSSFRSVTNRLKGSRKKISAAMVQRGGRLIPISA